MSSLVQAVLGATGRGTTGQSEQEPGVGTGLDNAKVLQFTQDRWNDLKSAYIVYHQAVWETFLFYANQTWIEWDNARKFWQPVVPDDEWVPQPRINRFSPTIDAVASNIYQVPEVEATPNPDDDPVSTMVAQVCTDLAEYAMLKEGFKRQIHSEMDKSGLAAQLFILAGAVSSLIRVTPTSLQSPSQSVQKTFGYQCDNCDKWNMVPVGQEPPKFCPECGNPVEPEDAEMMAPDVDESGQPVMQDNNEYEISCEIGCSLNMFPRPGAQSVAESPYLLWAKRQPTDTIYFRHNKFEAEPDNIWPDGYAVTYEHALNFWYTGYSSSSIQIKDSCMVLEMFVEPNKVKDHPDGFYAVVINEKIADSRPWNFPEHPLTLGGYLTLPTIFFPRSIGFDLVEIQRELNSYESVIKLHSMVSAVDPIVLDKNSSVGEVTGHADKIIYWRPLGPNAQPPFRLGAGHLDDGIYKQRDNLHAEFQNISMAVNAFRGQQEGAVTAAAAIQQLRSQAELMFSKPVANWLNFWCETIRKYVKFMQKFLTVEQLVRILGPNRLAEIQAFKAADLDNVTQWVASSHGIPRTRDEKRQEFMALWDKGALDITDPSVRQKIHDLFGETGMMDTFNEDATNARLENQLFKTGTNKIPGAPYIPPKIVPLVGIEDMPVHLYFHKRCVKSQDFQKWPPEAKQALIQHTLLTMAEIQQQALAQAKAMGQGGPDDKSSDKSSSAGPKTSAQSQGASGARAAQGAPPQVPGQPAGAGRTQP